MPSQELVCVTALSEETPTTQISDAQFGLRSQRHDQSSFKLTSFSTVDLSTAQQMLNNTSCLFLESKLDNIPLKLSPRGNSYKPKGTAQLLNPTSQNGHLKFHAATRMLLKWTKMKFKLKKKPLFPLSELPATGQHLPECTKCSSTPKPWQRGHCR